MTTAANRFTQLYEAHYEAVERYVRRRVDDEAVRDVVAEVFLTAWRRLNDLPTEPLPWLYGTARKVLANERRGAQRRVALASRIAENTSTDSADHADAVAARMAVAAALSRLSDEDAECLRLVAWEDLTLRRAAQALGCSLPDRTETWRRPDNSGLVE